MKLTAEQEFLRALAEWFDTKSTPMNQIQEASQDYLASIKPNQFREVKEKADHFTDGSNMVVPQWTPEVGKLYQHNRGGWVSELTDAFVDGNTYWISNMAYQLNAFYDHFTPIAELEGLKEGDEVWSIGENGHGVTIAVKWNIEEDGAYGTFFIVRENKFFTVHKDGSMVVVGNGKQLFWRTKDRAERFGKGE